MIKYNSFFSIVKKCQNKGLFYNGLSSYFHTTQTQFIEIQRLEVESFGEPSKVVRTVSAQLPDSLKNEEVLVKCLAAPINPGDINTIQGVYAIKPPLPFIPGNEGVMEVIETGSAVSTLSKGDWVIPLKEIMGTFSTGLICPESSLFKVPKEFDIPTLATLSCNPGTAYRMLRDFVKLQPGDVVAQNCANSAVGLAAIQISKTMDVKTINIVRDRPDIGKLKEHLYSLGASLVVTEDEVRTAPEVKELPKPKLAFNGASGKKTSDLIRLLEHNGTMVTYGGMSKQPLMVPLGAMIFNNVILKGFWMTGWNMRHKLSKERKDMFEDLFKMAKDKALGPPPYKLVAFDDYKTALHDTMPPQGKIGYKQIFVFK